MKNCNQGVVARACARISFGVFALALSHGLPLGLLLGPVSGLLSGPLSAQTPVSHVRARQPMGPALRDVHASHTPSLLFQDTLSLNPMGPCSPAQAWPWTATHSPDGSDLYVSLFGGYFGNGGCAVVRLDAKTLQWKNTIPVGESPEEIVFTHAAGGAMQRGFVTNSSGSSVTVFGANQQVLTTVNIPLRPGNTFGTAFPFGMAVAPDQSTVWIGTGEGFVYALDVSTLSLDPARTLDFGADHGFGRIAFAGDKLLLTTTKFHTNWLGSTASLVILDPEVPASQQQVFLHTSNITSAYPSPQDLAVHADGRVFVAGFDMGARVFVVDAQAALLVDDWFTFTQPNLGKFQALGLHGDFLIVADYWTGDAARIDTRTGGVAGLLSMQVFGQGPNEVTFAADGSELVVPMAGSNRLVRFHVQ